MYVRHGTITHVRREGTTYAEMLLSRNGTKTGRYMILAYDVMQSVRCSDACLDMMIQYDYKPFIFFEALEKDLLL